MSSLGISSENKKGLDALLDMLIPADSARGLPAGSEVGFIPDESFHEGLKNLDEVCINRFEKKFHVINPQERRTLIEGLSRVQKTSFIRLAKILAEFYYLRPEVARIIGAAEEPPFPEGYRVEEGDLTLVEPVYLRGKIFRDV